MTLLGTSFTFNGIPCEAFELMLYDIGSGIEDESQIASIATFEEETVSSRWRPYFYGIRFEEKLEFDITFGVNMDRLDHEQYLDRHEVDQIAGWLTGHNGYKWLMIDQDDLMHVRYRCAITSLSLVTYGSIPTAFRATVTCDSPYAYMRPKDYIYQINGETQIPFYNPCSLNVPYKPVIEFTRNSGSSFYIINTTDAGRKLEFTNIPESVSTIKVNNDKYVIENDQALNLYPLCNLRFLRLHKGMNHLIVDGNGTLKITCEFPVNTGG